MDLLPEARSVIVGSLLGDGYLYPKGTLQIEHCLLHAEHTYWKYEKLRMIAGKEPAVVERYDARTGKTYRSSRFFTKAVLKDFRAAFYPERKKIIPSCLGDWLDPLALAVWFMDDGSRGARTPKGLVFNTSCFSSQEQIVLQSLLQEKFGVTVSVHNVGKGYQLYVQANSYDRFHGIVFPHLVALMRYKLPVDPVTTSLL
jgi:hypothetical protein